jgi:hypothetical protein
VVIFSLDLLCGGVSSVPDHGKWGVVVLSRITSMAHSPLLSERILTGTNTWVTSLGTMTGLSLPMTTCSLISKSVK